MNSAIDEQIIEIHTTLVGARGLCEHLVDKAHAYVCYRCFRDRTDPVLCQACMDDHQLLHDADDCYHCGDPLDGSTLDAEQDLRFVGGHTKLLTGKRGIRLGRVTVLGRFCWACVAQHDRDQAQRPT